MTACNELNSFFCNLKERQSFFNASGNKNVVELLKGLKKIQCNNDKYKGLELLNIQGLHI